MKLSLIAILIGLSISAHAEPMRLGWQIPWSLQGQLVQILKHTDILKKEGLDVTFVGKTYGPELNELALAGQVDVILTADQPTATLFAKSEEWVGVARLMYNRTSTYVPPSSEIRNITDLKNKTVGVPFGAAAQRILIEGLKLKNLDPSKDVKLINLGIQEHIPLVTKTKPDSKTWDQFDALSGFDPVPAILEAKGLVRTIHSGKVCSLIVMNKSFLAKNKTEAKKLVAAFEKAYAYYKKNMTQANQWFLEEAHLKDADDKTLLLTTSFEPNLTKSKINMGFSKEDYSILEHAADFVAGAVGKKVDMKSKVSTKFLE